MKFDKKTTAKIEKILAVFSDFLEDNDHMGVCWIKKTGLYLIVVDNKNDVVSTDETIKTPEQLFEALTDAVCIHHITKRFHQKELSLGELEELISAIRAELAPAIKAFPEYKDIVEKELASNYVIGGNEPWEDR